MTYQAAPSIFDKPLYEARARRERDADEWIAAAFSHGDKLKSLRTLSFSEQPVGPEVVLHYVLAMRKSLWYAENLLKLAITSPELAALANETINARPAPEENDEHMLTASQCL